MNRLYLACVTSLVEEIDFQMLWLSDPLIFAQQPPVNPKAKSV